ncbi:LYR motif-containing protein 1-like [Artemia franciscana]|uniref:Complex 1 LYR protein domain-containing protein n=1 Tax=Artemia franciscana TaxID=6661 RepID=A0AA88I5T3_ARTSF|nr:hypothetical protein QYM36_003933 [Artemia franciscana]
MSIRRDVLGLYRRVIGLSKSWTAKDPADTAQEQNYIRDEARKLFRKNKNEEREKEILDLIHEGEARIEMALHYRNPYPRPVNLPPKSYSKKEGKAGRAIEQKKKKSRPIYLKSIDDI